MKLHRVSDVSAHGTQRDDLRALRLPNARGPGMRAALESLAEELTPLGRLLWSDGGYFNPSACTHIDVSRRSPDALQGKVFAATAWSLQRRPSAVMLSGSICLRVCASALSR